MWIFDYDQNEDVRAFIAYVFTATFVIGPIIWQIGFWNFIVGTMTGLTILLAQFGIVFIIKETTK